MSDNFLGFQLPAGGQPQSNGFFDDPRFKEAVLSALMGGHQQQQQQGSDFAGLLAAARNDPQGDRNRSSPGLPGNPFDNGFFKNSASQLSPEALLASQGGNAMNQWGTLGQLPGVDATQLGRMNNAVGAAHMGAPQGVPDYAAAAMHASPDPFQISPESSALAHGRPTAQSMLPTVRATPVGPHGDLGALGQPGPTDPWSAISALLGNTGQQPQMQLGQRPVQRKQKLPAYGGSPLSGFSFGTR